MGDAMNASPHHPKVKVSLVLVDSIFVAGSFVSGKMEMECKAEEGLGINNILVELFAVQGMVHVCQYSVSSCAHSS